MFYYRTTIFYLDTKSIKQCDFKNITKNFKKKKRVNSNDILKKHIYVQSHFSLNIPEMKLL